MPQYRVKCIRHGYVDIEAQNEQEAEDMAEGLPAGDFSWEAPEEHEVVKEIE